MEFSLTQKSALSPNYSNEEGQGKGEKEERKRKAQGLNINAIKPYCGYTGRLSLSKGIYRQYSF